jgi:uncharacterized membrane protein YfcA
VQLDPVVLLILGGVGMLAGFVDAIAGGGALIGIPALLLAGVPPIAALGTNKVQSVVGTAIAAATYRRGGLVPIRRLGWAAAAAFAASFCGALVVRSLDTALLSAAVPLALIAVALYFLLAPRLTDADQRARLDFARFVPVMAAVVGFYDGLLGPGAGSFLTVGFITLFGLGVTRAVGHTKAVNVASNLGALALLIPTGAVVWPAALAMAVGQLAGGYLGARAGMRFGARIIRPLVVAVSVILALKLLFFP